jgi:hypothetical protein
LYLITGLLFILGALFIFLAEHGQVQIMAQGELNLVSLNSSSTSVGENNTDVLSNDSLEEKMQIQICDASHPC